MQEWWSRIVVLALLAVVLAVPLLLRPGASEGTARAGAPRLVIVTPHNEQIRFEFSRAFHQWRAGQNLPAVEVDWRSWGGTSDLRKGVLDAFTKAAERGREDDGVGYDLFFGGGDFEHNLLARGVKVRRGDQDVTVDVTVPVELPAGFLQEVYPTPDIGGSLLYHPKRQWLGVVLSSFGIVYNRDPLGQLGLPEPQTWADLTDPRYRGWVALADPAHSGSIAVTYDTILRRSGWSEGWKLLRRAFANSRYFTASASKVPVDVSAGEAAAGMCIDFYGRFQAGAVGGSRVGYVDPPYMTAITADPISILRGSPAQAAALRAGRPASEGLANQFVVWLLSPEAQGLWQRRVGVPGGPARHELRRLPVRRDLYTSAEMQHWADQVQPFEIAKAMPADLPSFYRLVAPLTHALGADIHDDLKSAWAAIQREPAGPRREEMLRLFDAMPPELATLWPADWTPQLRRDWEKILRDGRDARRAGLLQTPVASVAGVLIAWDQDRDRRATDQLRWMLFFRDRYRQVTRLGEQD